MWGIRFTIEVKVEKNDPFYLRFGVPTYLRKVKRPTPITSQNSTPLKFKI